MINKFFNYYLRIIKLETGYKPTNKYFIIFIIFIGIVSILLRNYIMRTFSHYSFIVNALFSIIILNIIYLQFNLFCRVTLILFKGLPYFYK